MFDEDTTDSHPSSVRPRTGRTSAASRWPVEVALAGALALAACADGDPGGATNAGSGASTDSGETNTDSGATSSGSGATNTSDDGPTSDSGAPTGCGEVELSEWEQMMLDAHNTWRGAVEPPAADMYRVYWDLEIAANAAAWVSSCDPDWPHSSEEDRSGVGGYEILGENLSYCAGTGCADNPAVTDGSGMGDGEGWWEERHDYNWDDDSSTGITSHYTQMTSSNIYAIGCATQHCAAPGPGGWDGDWWWTICQYGPRGHAYWSGTKPYEAGPGGLVEPPATVFDDHPGLCGP